MQRNSNPGYELSSPMLRKVFAVAAVAATLATAGFIDALAHGFGVEAPVLAQNTPMVVARR